MKLNGETLLLAGLAFFMGKKSGASPPAQSAPKTRPLRAAGWQAYLVEAGANPELARGLERAAAIRGLAPSPMAARGLLDAFKRAWADAKKHLSPMPVPHTEDQLYFSVLQITEPTLLKGAGTPVARTADTELRHHYKDDERVGKILDAAAHVAWGAPLKLEGEAA